MGAKNYCIQSEGNRFLDAQGILLIDFLEGQKVIISAYCKNVLRKLKL